VSDIEVFGSKGSQGRHFDELHSHCNLVQWK